jgi:molybdenum cofactor cytidylyltransferase
MQKFGILVLAAGQSSRFDGDKLMASMPDDRPVIAHSLEPIIGIAKKYDLAFCVITRANNKALIEYLEQQQINYRICPDAESGMGHSIAHGIKSNQAWQGWMISLADMPNLNSDILETLIYSIANNPDKIVRPLIKTPGSMQAFPGHPVYFPQKYGFQLSKLKGDSGAKQLIKELNKVEVHDGFHFMDVDTKEALEQAVRNK